MSGHLDGPPPGPPDPPYIPGDMGAPSAEEFARRRGPATPEPERNPQEGWTPTSDGPEPIEYECELCGAKLSGPHEQCGSAQHGPNGTVVYGRAVPTTRIPDEEFTNPWRDSFPPGRLDAALKANAWDHGFAAGLRKMAAHNEPMHAALVAFLNDGNESHLEAALREWEGSDVR